MTSARLLLPLLATLLAVGCASPPHRVDQIGLSIQSRPIYCHHFGAGPVRVLVLGGIHGSEPTSSDCARYLAELLYHDPSLSTGRTILLIPSANPDGLAHNQRTNTHHVDLNRNFPAHNYRPSTTASEPPLPSTVNRDAERSASPSSLTSDLRPRISDPLTSKPATTRALTGPAPLSEPESRALHALILSFKPHLIISIHSIERNRQCNNYDGPAGDIARAMSACNHYPATPTIGYPTPGSLGSWAGQDLRIPMITLELPHAQPAAQAWDRNKEALRASLRAAQLPKNPRLTQHPIPLATTVLLSP